LFIGHKVGAHRFSPQLHSSRWAACPSTGANAIRWQVRMAVTHLEAAPSVTSRAAIRVIELRISTYRAPR
jgi:hypothetical protein